MLTHTSTRSYEVAASEASAAAKNKLEALIEGGKRSGAQVIQKVMTEVPTDRIVKGTAITFDGDVDEREETLPEGILAALPPDLRAKDIESDIPSSILETIDATQKKYEVYTIHRHALSQICQRAGLPLRYAQYLQEEQREGWGSKLLAHNLNEIYGHFDSRYLLRSYDGQLRGFLSDRFRRLDSRPIVEEFAKSCQKVGAVPIEGYSTETKIALKAMLPMVFEPVPNEVLAFGVCLENSDYGNGALSLRVFMLRLWCTNYAIADESLRQVHLGKRLTDSISWSNRTYDLDTRTMGSAISDVVGHSLSEEKTTELCGVIRQANEEKIDPRKAIEKFKRDLTKGEVESVTTAYNMPDVEQLPPGNTLWRMSNAISWVAGNTDDVERKLELMKVAGKVLKK